MKFKVHVVFDSISSGAGQTFNVEAEIPVPFTSEKLAEHINLSLEREFQGEEVQPDDVDGEVIKATGTEAFGVAWLSGYRGSIYVITWEGEEPGKESPQGDGK